MNPRNPLLRRLSGLDGPLARRMRKPFNFKTNYNGPCAARWIWMILVSFAVVALVSCDSPAGPVAPKPAAKLVIESTVRPDPAAADFSEIGTWNPTAFAVDLSPVALRYVRVFANPTGAERLIEIRRNSIAGRSYCPPEQNDRHSVKPGQPFYLEACGSGLASLLMTTTTNTPIDTLYFPVGSILTDPISPPEHMTNVWWAWPDDSGPISEFHMDFTIHNDPDLSGENGLYLMLCSAYLADIGFYFGIQTKVFDPKKGYRGKGLIFSRWDERNLANARIADGGWTQSSGHEGDFIGVRRSYDWGPGEYRVRFGPDDRQEGDGWFGVWISREPSGTPTWFGSLKFPRDRHGFRLTADKIYTTLEVYGGTPIRPIDIPEWHVSIKRPITSDGIKPIRFESQYSGFTGKVVNSNVRYDPTIDAIHFQAGGSTRRTQPPESKLF